MPHKVFVHLYRIRVDNNGINRRTIRFDWRKVSREV